MYYQLKPSQLSIPPNPHPVKLANGFILLSAAIYTSTVRFPSTGGSGIGSSPRHADMNKGQNDRKKEDIVLFSYL